MEGSTVIPPLRLTLTPRKLPPDLLGHRGRNRYHLRNAKVKLAMKENQEESFEAKCHENVISRKDPRNLSELHE